MSSPANTSIYFQLTEAVVNDKKQTNATLKERTSLICKHGHCKKTKRDNVIDAICNSTTPCLSLQKCISVEGEEWNDILSGAQESFVCKT